MPQLSLHSPVGDLTLSEEDGVLVAVDWGWGRDQADTALLRAARQQMHAFFDDDLAAFDLPLAPAATAFQDRVRAALLAIPRGQTRSYGDLARRLDSSARAVGLACARNPLPILVPCHRVLAGDGALRGYAGEGGVETKRDLLRLEGAIP
ncbi:methylated-DNA-[protein]-cysteine S-methyltransferase [Rhodothalassium salexigens DSM 2132]|uniref:Methylated-DNA--protein-cysteine methyltransferase n=1 Tax=Rhodothalassium salexigens DSM 2132 TaxID=1188247 RepID=A0A4V2SPQ8_RHOSA|nr:methylated-DNA--[protein]-cysteine S-methyltransferase [Rhodothalassium salexigens]MBB4211188.1 methylated-DNA-[protein]-cysteine S-methyltransferase [Rhodothalassium salexigens DSM 2132]MBK1637528.1 cysteine methyltransferase [Rhodothalassium salexigens DSM 2132]TCP36156.1 methylated-DNA-[protein]-cysteine S-methyltransferase [Rhodothalassium salexigens DSM 2132]